MRTTALVGILAALAAGCSPAGGGTPTTGGATTAEAGEAAGSGSGTLGPGTAGSSAGGSTAAGSTTTGGPTCEATAGECRRHEDCMSGYCETYSTAPPDPDATCQRALPEGRIRLTGTVRDFETRMPVAQVQIRVAGALDAAANPATTPGILSLTADMDGRFAVETDQADGQAIGLVALSETEGYTLTVTGLVEADISDGSYPPGATNHDVWVVRDGFIDDLNAQLAADPELAPFLPLVDQGGVLGRVRDPDCGEGVAGVELVSRAGAQSTAKIRYLADDGTFTDTATGSSGVFVILAPALAEKFEAMKDGVVVGEKEATVGSAPGGIFAVTVTLVE